MLRRRRGRHGGDKRPLLKYVVPPGRSQRNLALLRRCGVLKVTDPRPQRRCAMCGCQRRLGRWWCPPRCLLEAGAAASDAQLAGSAAACSGLDEAMGQYLWYCHPCWREWLVRYKQWFVEEDWGPESPISVGRVTGKAAALAGHGPNGSSSQSSSPTASSRPGWSSSSSSCPTLDVESTNGDADDGDGSEHYDFVEIGTSNYHTFTQSAASHPDGKPCAWQYLRWCDDPTKLRGLAVDLKQRYLDQLPDLPRVTKVRAAVSETDGLRRMYHVPLRDIERWEDVFAALGSRRGYRAVRLAHGCSALGRHRVLQRTLGQVGLRHLIRVRRMRTVGLRTLLQQQKVKSIGVLALDCEGHDCAILRGLMHACDGHPQWYPQWILFETNGMNDELFGRGTERQTVCELKRRGYEVWYGGGYRETSQRDTVLKRCW
mmetsp:Transcript_138456/g.386201  ORF Transcript_138456/g.386201 Transcript_138456/m.386201 type:complete len:430 (-) Transcript_138456:149-1438(-)